VCVVLHAYIQDYVPCSHMYACFVRFNVFVPIGWKCF
jgi:hypothetical protein